MRNFKLPLSQSRLEDLTETFPTPFYLYDEMAIRRNARDLLKAFAWNAGFKEYFAVKATPNPFIMKILQSEGFGMDCSSLPELLLAEKVGVRGPEIMFSSNDTPANEFQKARQLDATINLDDISHIPFLEKNGGIPKTISIRYNPGKMKKTKKGSFIMGNPADAKYGFTRENVFTGFQALRDKESETFGIHTFVASNELDPAYFAETADLLFHLVVEIRDKLGINLSFVNLSGGIGIPYKPGETKVSFADVGMRIKKKYDEKIWKTPLHPLSIFMECGRSITGPYGYLVSRVLHKKEIYKTHIGLDACMANLMRPGMYPKAYHHLTVVGKESMPETHKYDVTGSLCESNDVFAKNRMLPEIQVGDLVVIHDTGAHGHSMGFNYNGKLRSSELLLREDGTVVEIRRPETVEDHFATLDFCKLKGFESDA